MSNNKTVALKPAVQPAPNMQRVLVELSTSDANRYTLEALLHDLIDKGFDVAWAELPAGERYRLAATRAKA